MTSENFLFEDDLPKSQLYDEGYYGFKDGLDESRYVFLDGNGLVDDFSSSSPLVVAETGFGTGLNLLALLERRSRWANQPPLHFISVEAHPLSRNNFESCHKNWPELEPWRNSLAEAWPPTSFGWKRLNFKDLSLTVDIFHGTVDHWFEEFPTDEVDHWFLDGFSPSKNPDMWTDQLFADLARFSKKNSTLATFSAAGFIRRNLGSLGFSMTRRKGYGQKREMLTGTFEG